MADFEADRVVVELLAEVSKFDGKVVQSATQFDASITAALEDQEEALRKVENADRSAALQAAAHAANLREQAIEVRNATVALLENALAQQETLRIQAAQHGGSLRETGVNAEFQIIEARIGEPEIYSCLKLTRLS